MLLPLDFIKGPGADVKEAGLFCMRKELMNVGDQRGIWNTYHKCMLFIKIIKIIKGNCCLLGLFLVFEIDINKIMISFQTCRIEVAIATSYKNND